MIILPVYEYNANELPILKLKPWWKKIIYPMTITTFGNQIVASDLQKINDFLAEYNAEYKPIEYGEVFVSYGDVHFADEENYALFVMNHM